MGRSLPTSTLSASLSHPAAFASASPIVHALDAHRRDPQRDARCGRHEHGGDTLLPSATVVGRGASPAPRDGTQPSRYANVPDHRYRLNAVRLRTRTEPVGWCCAGPTSNVSGLQAVVLDASRQLHDPPRLVFRPAMIARTDSPVMMIGCSFIVSLAAPPRAAPVRTFYSGTSSGVSGEPDEPDGVAALPRAAGSAGVVSSSIAAAHRWSGRRCRWRFGPEPASRTACRQATARRTASATHFVADTRGTIRAQLRDLGARLPTEQAGERVCCRVDLRISHGGLHDGGVRVQPCRVHLSVWQLVGRRRCPKPSARSACICVAARRHAGQVTSIGRLDIDAIARRRSITHLVRWCSRGPNG